jgi:hypothetical protein
MKSRLLIFCCVCFGIKPFTLRAQDYFYDESWYDSRILFELGLATGVMNCFTDLGGNKGPGKNFTKDLNLRFTRPAIGLYGAFLYDQSFGLRLELNYGTATAADSILKADRSAANERYQRNLHFRSRIIDLLLVTELYPVRLLYGRSGFLSFYLLAGIGIFHFEPKARLGNEWVGLRDLRTEGQGFKEYPERRVYKRTAICLPLGFGLRYEVSAIVNTRFELAYRFTGTDYLDDVSQRYIDPTLFHHNLNPLLADLVVKLQDRSVENGSPSKRPGDVRGNPEKKDSYFSLNFRVGIVLNRVKRSY